MSRGRFGQLVVASALALVTAACWPQPGGNPGHTNHNGLEDRLTIDVVGSLEEAWQAPLQLGPV